MTNSNNRSFESIIPPKEAYSSAGYVNLFTISAQWFAEFYAHHRRHYSIDGGMKLGKNTELLLQSVCASSLYFDALCCVLGAVLLTITRLAVSRVLQQVKSQQILRENFLKILFIFRP